MIIGIEAQRIFRKNKHGMDYVVLQEIKELQQIDTENEYYVFVKPGEDRCIESTKNVHIIELNCPSYPLWEQWALPRAAKKYGVEILHCTSNTAPIWCNIPLVLTLHDIIFLEPRDKQNHSLYQNMLIDSLMLYQTKHNPCHQSMYRSYPSRLHADYRIQ